MGKIYFKFTAKTDESPCTDNGLMFQMVITQEEGSFGHESSVIAALCGQLMNNSPTKVSSSLPCRRRSYTGGADISSNASGYRTIATSTFWHPQMCSGHLPLIPGWHASTEVIIENCHQKRQIIQFNKVVVIQPAGLMNLLPHHQAPLIILSK